MAVTEEELRELRWDKILKQVEYYAALSRYNVAAREYEKLHPPIRLAPDERLARIEATIAQIQAQLGGDP
jgi:hypothetical protein